jgi:phage terminase small subunit
MAKERSPNRDKAFELWKNSNDALKLKDIAEQLGVSDNQIRKWKNQDKWDELLKGTLPKTNSNVTNKKGTPKGNGNAKGNADKKHNVPIEGSAIDNDELTDKQRIFCIYYVKCFNATQAALKAGYSSDTARQIGYENMTKPYIKDEIRRLKSLMINDIFVEAMDVLNVYIKIAFTDITDYLTFGQKEVPVMTMFGPMYEGEGDDRKPVTKIVNYVDFRPSDEIDGTLISEVKQGKDGVSIKLVDKMKALDKLDQYFDLFPDHFKRKIEEEKSKIDRERLELDKLKAAGEGDLDEELIDDWVEAVMDDGEDGGDEETVSGIQEEDTSISEES